VCSSDLFGSYGDLYWPAFVAGIAMALLAGGLSVFVVTRRLAFVGQGVSHTAFGGVGLAAVLGLTENAALTGGGRLLVAAFCVLAAVLIGVASGRRSEQREDTLIGVVLVASMALGMLLYRWETVRHPGNRLPSFEGVLFGSFFGIGKADAMIAWGVSIAVLASLWFMRRSLVFVVFDEQGAEAAGVRTMLVRSALMAALGVSIVLVMDLAGVVLASALLVLPGAAACAMCVRLRPSVIVSLVLSVLGVVGGVLLSFELDWPPGPSVVTVMVGVYLAARIIGFLTKSARA